jgi:hypothetical protein
MPNPSNVVTLLRDWTEIVHEYIRVTDTIRLLLEFGLQPSEELRRLSQTLSRYVDGRLEAKHRAQRWA